MQSFGLDETHAKVNNNSRRFLNCKKTLKLKLKLHFPVIFFTRTGRGISYIQRDATTVASMPNKFAYFPRTPTQRSPSDTLKSPLKFTLHQPYKAEAQTALFKDPVRTAL